MENFARETGNEKTKWRETDWFWKEKRFWQRKAEDQQINFSIGIILAKD
jgi:hypothetical protein